MATKPCIAGIIALLAAASQSGMLLAAPLDTQPHPQYVTAEPGEVMQGGATTHNKRINSNAFSHSAPNMDFSRQLDFKIGDAIFRKLWVSSPSSTTASDGLGPLYNARSCERCHLKDGRGHPPQINLEDNAISMFLRLSIPAQNESQQAQLDSNHIGTIPEPTYGGQLQDSAVPGLTAEGRMQISYSEIPVPLSEGETATLRQPGYRITDLAFGPLHPDTMISPRVAPPMIGLGLLEAINEEDILALADPDDHNNDGISGRANKVWNNETQQIMLGRFGWKAGNPTLSQQNNGAFNGDIGISTPNRPNASGDCTANQQDCLKRPNGDTAAQDGVEASHQMTDLVLFYSRNLALPARRNVDKPEVLAGKRVFYENGCIQCHRAKFITAKRNDMPEQSEQLIWPYSDLLLHDMGAGLADNRPEFTASGREWRTPPLWGIGLTKVVSGHTNFLHDGRARNLLEAILWHGGEAEQAKQAVINMPKQQRKDLIQFLESL